MTTYLVSGMTCRHCVSAVTDELRAVPGVQGVEVTLVEGGHSRVTVAAQHPLDEAQVAAAVDEAGYELVGVADDGAQEGRDERPDG
jgi:copper chaperone CopZ